MIDLFLKKGILEVTCVCVFADGVPVLVGWFAVGWSSGKWAQ